LLASSGTLNESYGRDGSIENCLILCGQLIFRAHDFQRNMNVYLINLARRPDRLEAMTRQLQHLDIPFERFDAVDAQSIAPALLNAPFRTTGPLGPLSPGDKACTCSHLALWQRIAADTGSYAVILKDDIYLSDAARGFLTSKDWIPAAAGLVKLEQYGVPPPYILVGKDRRRALDREIAPLVSRHTGSGGYIIAREQAALLAEMIGSFNLPIDHLLFNPNNSPVFAQLRPWQLLPAILDQRPEVGGTTDIHATRKATKPRGMALIKRQLTRNYYDLRLVPRQIGMVLTGQARPVRVTVA
jgi:glycosyl transferase family 25